MVRGRSCAVAVLAIVAVAGTVVASRADAAGDTVRVVPEWRKGQKARYDVVKTRRKSQPGKPAAESVARSTVDVEVLDAGLDTYVVGWSQGETTIEGATAEQQALAKKMEDLSRGLRIEIGMDSMATFTGVRNWKEVQAALKKASDTMCDELKAKGLAADAIAKIRAQAAPMYASEMLVTQSCARDPLRLFMPLGYEFPDGKPIEYDEKLPNPFGGEPLPCKARFSLREVDEKLGVATVDFRQALNPADAQRIMETTLKAMAERLGKPAPEGSLPKSFSIEDTAEFRVRLANGWVESATHRRVTKADDASQEDVISFKLTSESAAAPTVATDFPDDGNGEILRNLVKLGDDLTKPRDVDFHFAFPTRARADAFAAEVKKTLGLETATEELEGEDVWSSTVTKNMVPTHDGVTKLEASLVAVAKTHLGEPEGWGCGVVTGK